MTMASKAIEYFGNFICTQITGQFYPDSTTPSKPIKERHIAEIPTTTECLLLQLPLEIQLMIYDVHSASYKQWPLLCVHTAVTSRFNYLFQKHGKWKYWSPEGFLKVQCGYMNGRKHGQCMVWYSNGILKKKFSFLHGYKHGPYQEWFRNGNKRVVCDFNDGKRVGAFTAWHMTRHVKEEGFFINGKAEGEFVKKWDTGVLKKRSFFSDGKREGVFEQYSPNGRLVTTKYFKYGMEMNVRKRRCHMSC
mmetsp:Transcript_16093/g.17882  ORF Transcript_16093/g.17882 Transcript_16093/m.17882 type:complete len:248 (-) Transcript_16093:17-760(-)